MTPTLNDHLIAMAAHTEVFGRRGREASDSLKSFGCAIRALMRRAYRDLTPLQRRHYRVLRREGQPIKDALARAANQASRRRRNL